MSNEHFDHPASGEIPPQRVTYYEQRTQAILDAHTRSFDQLTRDQRGLVRLGDRKLRSQQATGYNVLLTEEAMPLRGEERLIFYHNYIGRTHHFGLLLAAMEQAGIITEDQVRFGVKGSKVVNIGVWEPDPVDEVVASITLRPRGADPMVASVSKTVETVVTFVPRDDDHARAIAVFLATHATLEAPQPIAGSWAVPDIRATANLAEALAGTSRFVLVQANLFAPSGSDARLLIARQRTRFRQRWRSTGMEINEELAAYLASPELGVAP